MRGNAHVRFGGRAEETDEPKGPHRASVRPDHTHVALLIEQGEHPRMIADRLGHTSTRVALDRYGHLFEGADAAAADRLDEAYAHSLAASTRPGTDASVIPFPTDRPKPQRWNRFSVVGATGIEPVTSAV